jgi:hypothetical protein
MKAVADNLRMSLQETGCNDTACRPIAFVVAPLLGRRVSAVAIDRLLEEQSDAISRAARPVLDLLLQRCPGGKAIFTSQRLLHLAELRNVGGVVKGAAKARQGFAVSCGERFEPALGFAAQDVEIRKG